MGVYKRPCGNCQLCRIQKQSNWKQRLKLEKIYRPYCLFVTLTYSDEYLPVFQVSKRAQLYKPDLIRFIDKLRSSIDFKITIFAVGEYGGFLFDNPEAERPIHPHYHLAIFSDDPNIMYQRENLVDKWDMGHCHVLCLSDFLIDYITSYTLKKLNNEKSMNRIGLFNLRPEFTYSSRRPAIGYAAFDDILAGAEFYDTDNMIYIDGRKRVLNSYLQRKLNDHALKSDLDLKNCGDYMIYETRLYFNKLKKAEDYLCLTQADPGREAWAKFKAHNLNEKINLTKHLKERTL